MGTTSAEYRTWSSFTLLVLVYHFFDSALWLHVCLFVCLLICFEVVHSVSNVHIYFYYNYFTESECALSTTKAQLCTLEPGFLGLGRKDCARKVRRNL